MALTETIQAGLGAKAPDFTLPNVLSGRMTSYSNVAGEKGTVVMFICNHCPFVVHVREQLVLLANAYSSKGIGFVAINSNDVANYPDDSPEKMKELAEALSFPFPYLFDEDQSVAKAYEAACTPDFMIYDGDANCVYRGQLDGSRPGNDIAVTGIDIRNAIDALLNGEGPVADQRPSMGCNIKWIVGNEPAYFG